MLETPIPRQKFYNAILEAYDDGKEMTARECAIKLFKKGLVPYPTRQCVQPRLTEMCKFGWFEVIGTRYDFETKKRVSVYRKVS